MTLITSCENITSDIIKQGYIRIDQRDFLRNHCDGHADTILSVIQSRRKERSEPHATRQKRDLYVDLQTGSKENDTLAAFWARVNATPDWVDWAQLERGQRVFHRYILASITGFVLQGFIAENSAATGVVEVLIRTGGFDPKNLTQRLEETFRWLLEVTSDLRSVQPGGRGHADTIRVRLLHAQVRQRILALTKRKRDYYDTIMYGIPVNTLDSIHSISTFCCSPMWTQLPRMGVHPTDAEIEDYIALFRYLAHLLGVPQELFSSTELARGIMHSMMENETQISDTSRAIARNFIVTITSSTPHKLSLGFIAAGSRYMNGDVLCDALDIPRPGLLDYATYLGCCWLAVALCLLQRAFGACDRFIIMVRGLTAFDFKVADAVFQQSRRALNQLFIDFDVADNDSSPPFIFRYVPSILQRSAGGKGSTTLRLAVDAERIFRMAFVIPAVFAFLTLCTVILLFYHAVRKLY